MKTFRLFLSTIIFFQLSACTSNNAQKNTDIVDSPHIRCMEKWKPLFETRLNKGLFYPNETIQGEVWVDGKASVLNGQKRHCGLETQITKEGLIDVSYGSNTANRGSPRKMLWLSDAKISSCEGNTFVIQQTKPAKKVVFVVNKETISFSYMGRYGPGVDRKRECRNLNL